MPHGVQHGLSTRIKTIVDHAVAEYTDARTCRCCRPSSTTRPRATARAATAPPRDSSRSSRDCRSTPSRSRARPFLFTISGLAEEADAGIPALPPLSDEAKAALRQEVGLADDYANMVGREVCTILLHHRLRIQAAISQYVEPQIEAMLEELTRSLDAPFDPNEPPPP